ncbi:Bug family tripartite tricarboxylate transporter substrate binding protein [Caproiciproducens faecalis]|uniref:Tripartite tricarboxylate transporter substrate binding protein n=1 Tax=Caproiciproducens faecalis TaxID=2820301 RepID=A0ABS7DJE6_9FIRM|nr:tripartite tricarboxylate transporter substrate binding protein [Caproiciproducens faecalis]MBW7571410.1 tripartite tricarboxylate transporter substrate binding protein [Caproiciproducens faecalis]
MKRKNGFLAFVLAASMMASLVGCSGSNTASSAAAGQASDTPAASAAAKSDFPKKPIQIICPVKAGGDTDRNARSLAKALQKYLNTTVVVTNVDGGATVMGMQQCLNSDPDGYTLVVNGTDIFVPNMMGTTDINLDSFKTVGIPAIDNSTVLAVNKASGYKDLKDLVEKSKAKPDSIEYGGKIGATNQMCGVAMNTEWGSKLKFVDVGNNAAKVTALYAKQTDVINLSYSVAKDYFTSGEFVPLVLLGSEKNDLLPNVPLASDSGYKNVDFSKFFWVGAPPKTPDDVIHVLSAAVEKASQDPDFVADMKANYLTAQFKGEKEAQEYADNFYKETMLPYKDAFLKAQ